MKGKTPISDLENVDIEEMSQSMMVGMHMATNLRINALELAISYATTSGKVLGADLDEVIETAERFAKFIIDDKD